MLHNYAYAFQSDWADLTAPQGIKGQWMLFGPLEIAKIVYNVFSDGEFEKLKDMQACYIGRTNTT